MEDRTSVELTVLGSQAKAAEALIGRETFSIKEDNPDGTTYLSFDEVNYGNLSFLPKLVAAGIAYNSRWGEGSEYTKGTEYVRFDEEGNVTNTTVYDNQMNPELSDLMKFLDKPEQLVRYIQNHYDKVTILPLDSHQEHNGKLYRTKQLISPA